MSRFLNEESLSHFESGLTADYKVRERAVTKNGIVNSAIDFDVKREAKPVFSIEVSAGNVTNQKQSGRCWMFAGLNVIRTMVMKKLHIKNFELSQSYLQFYDKLEKANFFLERIIELKDEPIDSRLNAFFLDNGIGDGGHFIMFTNLVKKYGVVPSYSMPETAVSSATTELNNVLNDLLHKDALILREKAKSVSAEDLETLKDVMLQDIYQVLVISLGMPPKEFTLEVRDKDDKFVASEVKTPLSFFKEYIEADLDAYIPLSDIPYDGLKRGECYYSHFVNNVEGGDEVLFYNVPVDVLKTSVINSLKGDEVVWFAADVLSQSLRKEGILASGIINYDELFQVKTLTGKAERMNSRTSFCNHAMTFTGVNLVNDKPNRFKVENSWGKDVGEDGFFVMSDSWFDDYVYQVLVNKKYVPEEYVKEYEEKKKQPIEISLFNTFFAMVK